jgi:hypothetical protein
VFYRRELTVRVGEVVMSETVREMLVRVFPRRVVEGQTAPHDCPECLTLRGQLSGVTWPEVPSDFIRDRPDALPLLSHEAYLAFLPAWLRVGAVEPDGEVAGMLLVNLGYNPDTAGFTADQRAAVVEVARHIIRDGFWGPDDPDNVKAMAAIERIWSEGSRSQ